MGSKSTARRKHQQTVRRRGQEIADAPDMVKRERNRLWWVASLTSLGLWYGVVLGARGFVCACGDQQGRHGICKHVVAVDIRLGRMWDAAKNMRARKTQIAVPETRCHNRECRSDRFVKYGTYGPKKRQRYMCRDCGRTFSGMPGFKGRHFEPAVITRALHEAASGLSAYRTSRILRASGIGVDPATIHRWTVAYSRMVDGFAKSMRPRVGHRWHCDEIFFKILGFPRLLFAVMDGSTRFILSWDVSDTKDGYKPMRLFEAARAAGGADPWIFVTDGLAAFRKAAIKAFRRRKGFRLVHVMDIHLRGMFNTNNLYERLNGEFEDRIKTVRGFNRPPNDAPDARLGGGCPGLVRLMIIYHNFFREHQGLNGITPAEAAGITIHGEDKWTTMIVNAALQAS